MASMDGIRIPMDVYDSRNIFNIVWRFASDFIGVAMPQATGHFGRVSRYLEMRCREKRIETLILH